MIEPMIKLLVKVAPFTGAWIEIKCYIVANSVKQAVAPFTGAWIEISSSADKMLRPYVAPFTGAWIEIHVSDSLM